MDKFFIVPGIAITIVITMVGYSAYNNYKHPIECLRSEKVVAIEAVKYRDVAIRLESGKIEITSHQDLRPGDMYCLERGRR